MKCGGFIICVALLETSLLDKEAQARALGVSKGCLEKAWKFFGFQKKLHPATAAAVSAGEHFFDEEIMKEHGYVKENGVSVFVWFAFLDDAKQKLVNNKAAQKKRENAKNRSTPTGVFTDNGKEVMKAHLRYETDKKTPTGVFTDNGKEVMKAHLRYETDKKTPTGVLNDKGQELMKSQLQYEKKLEKRKKRIRLLSLIFPRACAGGSCATCTATQSRGFITLPGAKRNICKMFVEAGFGNRMSEAAAHRNIDARRKRVYDGDECAPLSDAHDLCLRCWKELKHASSVCISGIEQRKVARKARRAERLAKL